MLTEMEEEIHVGLHASHELKYLVIYSRIVDPKYYCGILILEA